MKTRDLVLTGGDRVGVALSLACVIHCAAVPLLMALAPVVSWLHDLERPLVVAAVLYNLWCIGRRAISHLEFGPMLPLPPAIACFAAADYASLAAVEVVFGLSGGLFMIAARLMSCRCSGRSC